MSVLAGVSTALVTGASGGIGEAFAHQLAAMGKSLVLVARSREKLDAMAMELAAQHSIRVHVIAADLARVDAAQAIFEETERLGLAVDLLINNAGYGKAGDFSELPFEVQANMIRLNANTLVELTHFYLPRMQQKKRGGVINVGSTASWQPVPYMAVYGATKAFVLSFSEAVAQEVRADGVTVMALCPGWTATGFQTTAGVWEVRRDRMPTADKVAGDALRAFERRRSSYVHGSRNRLVAFFASRLLPRRFVTYMAAWVIGRKR
jgi:short-subunit dehydrogenase